MVELFHLFWAGPLVKSPRRAQGVPLSLWLKTQLSPGQRPGIDWAAVLPVRCFYCQSEAVREIWQYQYLSWPDHGVPSEPGGVLSFLDQINQKQESIPNAGPILVHCRLVQKLRFKSLSICSIAQGVRSLFCCASCSLGLKPTDNSYFFLMSPNQTTAC